MADRPLRISELSNPESPFFLASRTAIYKLLGSGALRAIKIGRATRILESERARFLATAPVADIRMGASR